MDFYGLTLGLLLTVSTVVVADHTLCDPNLPRTITSSPAHHDGYIASPNHPSSYPARSMQCKFKILPKPNEQVSLTFTTFFLRESTQVPASQNCDLSDSVQVFIGSSNANQNPGNRIGEYCGNSSPVGVMAVGRPLTVVFTVRVGAEHPTVRPKYYFKALYRFTKKYGINVPAEHNSTAGCHFIFDGRRPPDKGNFTSPNFGGLYPFSTNCLYTFKAFGNQSLRLMFQKFKVEGQQNCRRSDDDIVQIIEGEYNWTNFALSAEEDPAKQDPSAALYCGYKSPNEYKSNSKVVNVLFKSGQSMAREGFFATYEFIGHPGQFLPAASSSSAALVLATIQLTAVFLWITSLACL